MNCHVKRCTRIWGPERRWWLVGDDAQLFWEFWEIVNNTVDWQQALGGAESAGTRGVTALLRWLHGPQVRDL